MTSGGMRTTVADVVGATLASLGVDTVFGLMGSGNFVATEALVAGGARFVSARHEGGAVAMADGWARSTGRVGVASVHQGPGLTNTLTALAEAAKSRTPLLVLSGDTPARDLHSNFRIDQHDLVASVGAVAERVLSAQSAGADAARALRRAELERRPVVLNLPIDLQAAPGEPVSVTPAPAVPRAPRPAAADVARAAGLIAAARRVVIVAGRGAVVSDARDALELLADRCGALLCTSAVAHGFFAGAEFDAGISGGFVTPALEELLPQADLVLAFGATLNHWTTRGGRLLGPGAQVVQVDVDARAIGAHVPGALAVVGDATATAQDLVAELVASGVERREGFRTAEVAALLERAGRWSALPLDRGVVPGDGGGTGTGGVHPRALTQAVDAALPRERTVVVDSGHLTGWPAMDLPVPDARSWHFVNGFQAVGLGLGAAIGASVARPGRVTVAAVGDGGLFLALPELETAARLRLPLLVLVYDDAAYGAEVHHFGPQGRDVALARFPDADLAAIARGAGCDALTIRDLADLHEPLRAWVAAPHGPLVVDAKVDPTVRAAWLEDAFRAH